MSDNLDCISSNIAQLREMLDEYTALVGCDWALRESYLLHGEGHSVPIGILDIDRSWLKRESDRRVVAHGLVFTLIGALTLLALSTLAAETDLSAWIDRAYFALAWAVSSYAVSQVGRDIGTLRHIIQTKTSWGV